MQVNEQVTLYTLGHGAAAELFQNELTAQAASTSTRPAPPPETGAATKRKGGRPPGTTRGGENARKYGIRLPGPEAERLEAAAAAEGIRPGAWIYRAVLRALETLGGK